MTKPRTKMKTIKPQIMWFIHGNCGLYTGGMLTRKAAIQHHCCLTGIDWPRCIAKGDTAVKCLVEPIKEAKPRKRT